MKRYLTLTVTRKMIVPLRDITLLDRTKIKNDHTERLARKQKNLIFSSSMWVCKTRQSREHFVNFFKNVSQRRLFLYTNTYALIVTDI